MIFHCYKNNIYQSDPMKSNYRQVTGNNFSHKCEAQSSAAEDITQQQHDSRYLMYIGITCAKSLSFCTTTQGVSLTNVTALLSQSRNCSNYVSRCGRSGIESRWGRDFPPVQTSPGAHPASCKMGTGFFPRVKCGQGALLTTHPLLVLRSWESRAITLPTLWVTPGL